MRPVFIVSLQGQFPNPGRAGQVQNTCILAAPGPGWDRETRNRPLEIPWLPRHQSPRARRGNGNQPTDSHEFSALEQDPAGAGLSHRSRRRRGSFNPRLSFWL